VNLTNLNSSYLDKVFIALIVMLLFSSDRNLLITHYVLGGADNIGFMTISYILMASFFLFYLLVSRGSLIIQHSHQRLIIAGICLAIYFVVHELMFGDGLTSLKYAIYLLIAILSLMTRYNVYFIFKILGYIGGSVSLLVIVQQFLVLSIDGGDLSKFKVAIPGEEYARWLGCDFVKPYGLGLMERCVWGYDVYISGLKINRSIFFSTEPKYFSSLLLITFASLLLSKTKSLVKPFFLLMHVIAILFSASATAIVVLIISGVLIFTKFVGPKFYSACVFLLPIYLLPLLFFLLINLAGVDGFLLNRLTSAFHNMGEGGIQTLSLFGQPMGACERALCKDVGLLGNLTEVYGIVGFILFWTFLFYAIKPVFNMLQDREIDKSIRFGLSVLLNTYVVFNIYFFGDIFNMFGLLILLSIILIPQFFLETTPSTPAKLLV